MGSSGKLTSNAWGEFIEVTIQSWSFKPYSKGKGSYNFTNIVGLFGSLSSNKILLDINNSLPEKFNKKSTK